MTDRDLPMDIDESQCLGYGKCQDLVPDVFVVDEEGVGRIREDVDREMISARDGLVAAAVDACPTASIRYRPE